MATSVISKAVIAGTATAVAGLSGYLITQRAKKDCSNHWKLKRIKGNKWRLTNTHNKSVVLWAARLHGVAPYELHTTFLSENRALLPNESIELILHRDSSELLLDYTEYDDVEEAHNAFDDHLRNPDVPYGEFRKNPDWTVEPVAPFWQCDIRLWIY